MSSIIGNGPRRSSRPVDPRARALQMNSGKQISTLLNPLQQQSKNSKSTNHALINRQNLKAAQVRNHLRREEETARAQEEPFKMSRFKMVTSIVRQKTIEASIPTQGEIHPYTKKGEGKGVLAKLNTLSSIPLAYQRLQQGG